ncbi:SIZ1 [Candida pseudojiufengensis]|uniref:SIZ1 n=1 Tax=Candida pseudojiufengensis TaxID=497109 RepID=UPI0022252E69|nr:SIZ1 [Candida pseudojiufengensis]KAI5966324.1 SIZ1 [Candida pseudojiufengensis]
MSKVITPLTDEEYEHTKSLIPTLKVQYLKDVLRSMGLRQYKTKKELINSLVTYLDQGRIHQDHVRGLAMRTLIVKKLNNEELPKYHDLYNAINQGKFEPPRFSNSYRAPSQNIHANDSVANESHRLFFIEDPFYKLVRNVHGSPQVCPPCNGKTYTDFKFILTEEENAELKKDPSIKLYLLCGKQSNRKGIIQRSSTDVQVEYPSQVDVWVNGERVTQSFKGLKNRPGTGSPVNLTNLVLRHPKSNRIQFVYEKTTENFYIYLYLVRTTPIETVFNQIINAPKISRNHAIGLITKDEDEVDGIVMRETSINLKDPFSYSRIKYPVKAINCNHVQCFDAYYFLNSQLQQPTWECPTCLKTLKLKDLGICEYFHEILSNTGDEVEKVLIQKDGSWRPVVGSEEPKKMNHAIAKNDPDVVLIIDSDSEDDDTPINGRTTETAQVSPGANPAASTSTANQPIQALPSPPSPSTLMTREDEPLSSFTTQSRLITTSQQQNPQPQQHQQNEQQQSLPQNQQQQSQQHQSQQHQQQLQQQQQQQSHQQQQQQQSHQQNQQQQSHQSQQSQSQHQNQQQQNQQRQNQQQQSQLPHVQQQSNGIAGASNNTSVETQQQTSSVRSDGNLKACKVFRNTSQTTNTQISRGELELLQKQQRYLQVKRQMLSQDEDEDEASRNRSNQVETPVSRSPQISARDVTARATILESRPAGSDSRQNAIPINTTQSLVGDKVSNINGSDRTNGAHAGQMRLVNVSNETNNTQNRSVQTSLDTRNASNYNHRAALYNSSAHSQQQQPLTRRISLDSDNQLSHQNRPKLTLTQNQQQQFEKQQNQQQSNHQSNFHQQNHHQQNHHQQDHHQQIRFQQNHNQNNQSQINQQNHLSMHQSILQQQKQQNQNHNQQNQNQQNQNQNQLQHQIQQQRHQQVNDKHQPTVSSPNSQSDVQSVLHQQNTQQNGVRKQASHRYMSGRDYVSINQLNQTTNEGPENIDPHATNTSGYTTSTATSSQVLLAPSGKNSSTITSSTTTSINPSVISQVSRNTPNSSGIARQNRPQGTLNVLDLRIDVNHQPQSSQLSGKISSPRTQITTPSDFGGRSSNGALRSNGITVPNHNSNLQSVQNIGFTSSSNGNTSRPTYNNSGPVHSNPNLRRNAELTANLSDAIDRNERAQLFLDQSKYDRQELLKLSEQFDLESIAMKDALMQRLKDEPKNVIDFHLLQFQRERENIKTKFINSFLETSAMANRLKLFSKFQRSRNQELNHQNAPMSEQTSENVNTQTNRMLTSQRSPSTANAETGPAAQNSVNSGARIIESSADILGIFKTSTGGSQDNNPGDGNVPKQTVAEKSFDSNTQTAAFAPTTQPSNSPLTQGGSRVQSLATVPASRNPNSSDVSLNRVAVSKLLKQSSSNSNLPNRGDAINRVLNQNETNHGFARSATFQSNNNRHNSTENLVTTSQNGSHTSVNLMSSNESTRPSIPSQVKSNETSRIVNNQPTEQATDSFTINISKDFPPIPPDKRSKDSTIFEKNIDSKGPKKPQVEEKLSLFDHASPPPYKKQKISILDLDTAHESFKEFSFTKEISPMNDKIQNLQLESKWLEEFTENEKRIEERFRSGTNKDPIVIDEDN